jgi:arylsulfatase A-like enzyme
MRNFLAFVFCLFLSNAAVFAAVTDPPKVWIYTDMSDPTLPGQNHRNTVNDPDDVSAMAGYLLMANRFETLGIVVTSTHRKEHATSPDQAVWANRVFGEAYQTDLLHLKNLGGFPDDIQFTQSCIKQSAEKFADGKDYRSLEDYATVKSLFDSAKQLGDDEVINVLCWGSLTEPAILVAHCLATDNQSILKKLRFIAHWTNSPLHQGSPEHPEEVANCREDLAACRYLKSMAASGTIVYYECGAIGQHGIVSGSPKGNEYFDQFRTSRLGTLFVEGKYVHDCVDHSDSATYWTLLGEFGVSLKDIAADGTNSAMVEQANEHKFATASHGIHDELLRRSEIAGDTMGDNRPNVVLIILDDLNNDLYEDDSVQTPSLDRFAKSAITFERAYCNVPVCVPSRASMFSGLHAFRTGSYLNGSNPWESELLAKTESLPELFRRSGYHTFGCGKLFHATTSKEKWKSAWDEQPFKGGFGPFPPEADQVTGKFWGVTEWTGPDEDFPDVINANHAITFLNQAHDKPFFLCYGLWRPHTPFTAPQRFFDLYDENQIQVPPQGFVKDDLDDVPDEGKRMAAIWGERWKSSGAAHPEVWRRFLHGYKATTSFADWNVGRVLQTIADNGLQDNTIVIIWSDNGYHMGQKNHFEKATLWEKSAQTPLWIHIPHDAANRDGEPVTCKRTVSAIDFYPTLVDYCELVKPEHDLDGQSLRELLTDPAADRDRPVMTFYDEGSVSLRNERFRFIHYADGTMELYDHSNDPNEEYNVAGESRFHYLIQKFKSYLPFRFAPSLGGKNG